MSGFTPCLLRVMKAVGARVKFNPQSTKNRDSNGFHHSQLGFTKERACFWSHGDHRVLEVLLCLPPDWWGGLLSKTSLLGELKPN